MMSTNPVNVFTNDPNARGLSLEQVVPPTGAAPFAIPGWTGAGGLFSPGTPEFQAGELYVVLNRTYTMWADLFDATFPWKSGAPQLAIAPRAGQSLNAYYDRRGLRFFFDVDKMTGETIYTCESSDIVAHECGHALLDAQHPDYWDSLFAETVAFHEAFADISAILTTLDSPSVRAAIFAENGGDLTRSNVVTRLAEQLARAFVSNGQADLVVSADAIRDVANKFRYREPDKLPGRTPANKLSSESHNFSRVFSGAFYDLLVRIYEQLRQANTALSSDDALAQARNDVGHLLAHGLILAPRGEAEFKAVALAMFTVDRQLFAGKYFAALRQAFVGRRIVKAREADAQRMHVVAPRAEARGMIGIASGAIVTPAVADLRIGENLPSGYRRALQVPAREFRLVEKRAQRDASRVLQFTATRQVELKGKELGVARGVVVDIADAVAVHVDGEGRFMAAQARHADRAREEQVRDHVAKLVARGRVYEARVGEHTDPMMLIARRQPYYIAYDEQGNKRISRAFIA